MIPLPAPALSTNDLMLYLEHLACYLAQRDDALGLYEYFIECYGQKRLEYRGQIALKQARRVSIERIKQ